jgi:hypothetical protein
VQSAAQTESLLHKVVRRIRWQVRDTWPNRWVERDILGVSMAMPWSHRLPDYDFLCPGNEDAVKEYIERLIPACGFEKQLAFLKRGQAMIDWFDQYYGTRLSVSFMAKAELFVEVFRSAAERELEAMRLAAASRDGFAEQLEAVIPKQNPKQWMTGIEKGSFLDKATGFREAGDGRARAILLPSGASEAMGCATIRGGCHDTAGKGV